MSLPIELISTDFDGTIFAEFENPPIPEKLQQLIGDLSSLMEALARSHISIEPDFLILVEREIHRHDGVRYVGLDEWNHECARAHEELFARIRLDMPRLTEWVNERFHATIYEDPYSPFCLIAGNNGDANVINDYLDDYCRSVPNLVVMRNDVYARLSHADYNKGTALAELARHLGITADKVFAAGDHLNDLPMLLRTYARWIGAPQNAIDPVKTQIRVEKGFVSELPHGYGTADALDRCLKLAAAKNGC
jgi:hydroxymethylpyrimidine pyrophosphatase-like HAD family hydrolase